MKGKRIFSLLLATVCLLANTAAPALAAESIKEEVNEKNVNRTVLSESVQPAFSAASEVKIPVKSTAADPYTLTINDVNVERCHEDPKISDSPFIDAVQIVGFRNGFDTNKLKNLVIPETLPFDKPVLDSEGNEQHDDQGNVITESVEMPVIKWYISLEGNGEIEKVTLSKNLQVIGGKSFCNCQSLTEVVVPQDSELEEIGLGAFSQTAISEFYIPTGVEVLTDGASSWGSNGIFEGCKNLKTVTFAEDSKLKIIGMRTFMSSGLSSISLPDSVEEIHEGAFTECSLEEIALPELMTEIPVNAFNQCTSLKKVTFGNGLTTIGSNAFKNTALTEVVIPDTVTDIGSFAFEGITTLTTVTIGSGIKEISNAFAGSTNISTLNLSEGLEMIGAAAFRNSMIKKLTIPSTVKRICGEAFADCTALAELNFAEGSQLELISSTEGNGSGLNEGAFSGCTSLKSLKLPVSTTPFTIDDYTFERCSSLKEVELGNCKILGTTTKNSEFHFGGKVFCGCASLRTVEWGDCLEQIGFNCFSACTKLTGPIVFPESLRIIGDSAFDGCSSIEDVTFNEGLERIGYDETWCGGSFSGCDLHAIILPDSVKEVGNYCFKGNLHVGEIKLSANMTVIPDGFLDNYGQAAAAYSAAQGSHTNVGDHGTLKKLVIPEQIKEIGYDAFDGCLDLEYLDLGQVEYIGTGAFSCHNLLLGELGMEHASLKTVVMSPNLKEIGTRPPHTEYNSERGDAGNTETSYYGVFDGQGDFEGLVLPSTLEKVGKYAFVGCPAVKEFNMTDNMQLVDDHAFDGCANLKTLTFAPETNTTFGESAFTNCTSLTEVTLPSWLEVVPAQMFNGCKNLAKATFPEGIETLGNMSFAATALTKVELPESCLYIDDSVFQNSFVTKVKFGSKTKSIGANAFVKDTNLHLMHSVYIPETVQSIGEKAFGYFKDTEYTYEELCKIAEEKKMNVQNLISPTIADNSFVLYGGTAAKRYADENGMIYGGVDTPDTPDIPNTPDEPSRYGDIDGDGKISAKDSLNIQRYVINLKKLDENQLLAADVNGDGKVTAKDALDILRYTINMSKNDRIGQNVA